MPLYRCLQSSIVGGKLVLRGEFIEADAESLGVMAEHFTIGLVEQAPEMEGPEPPSEPEPDPKGVVAPVRRSRKADK